MFLLETTFFSSPSPSEMLSVQNWRVLSVCLGFQDIWQSGQSANEHALMNFAAHSKSSPSAEMSEPCMRSEAVSHVLKTRWRLSRRAPLAVI